MEYASNTYKNPLGNPADTGVSENRVWKPQHWPGTVAHACNPALWESKVGGSPEVRNSRPAWPTWRNPVSTKNIKINQVWWHMPIILATWEAKAEESLEFGRQRLQWAEIMPLYSI